MFYKEKEGEEAEGEEHPCRTRRAVFIVLLFIISCFINKKRERKQKAKSIPARTRRVVRCGVNIMLYCLVLYCIALYRSMLHHYIYKKNEGEQKAKSIPAVVLFCITVEYGMSYYIMLYCMMLYHYIYIYIYIYIRAK